MLETRPAHQAVAHEVETAAVKRAATFDALAATPPGWRGSGKLALVVVVLSKATARRRSALLEREKIGLNHPTTSKTTT